MSTKMGKVKSEGHELSHTKIKAHFKYAYDKVELLTLKKINLTINKGKLNQSIGSKFLNIASTETTTIKCLFKYKREGSSSDHYIVNR